MRLKENEKKFAIVILVCIILSVMIWVWKEQRSLQAETEMLNLESMEAGQPATSEDVVNISSGSIYVHVAGKVVNPGVYEVKNGSRLFQLVDLAGGPTKDASLDRVNLAQVVTDGTQYYIPSEDEEGANTIMQSGTSSTSSTGNVYSDMINLNTATSEELDTLPGVGEATAKKIIEYRSANGPFMAIEDIMNVTGIGEKKFSDMKAYIKV